ncbi:MAG: threonine synthase [Tenericutes bacterium HGW-Tenericutes-2]|nr:MAG: threonine synthase [Tenericutes bacterium HGW-Tenericutes-2]
MANFIKGFRCTLCNKIYAEKEIKYTCPSCGEKGILDVEFDYSSMKKFVDKYYFKMNPDFSMWRYYLLMGIDTKYIPKMLKIGGTPLYKANHLQKSLGIKSLYIKDEGQSPSGSLKDRASGVAVLKALENGYKTISCSSTGNAASSLACHAARMGLKTLIFVPKRAPIGKLNQLSIFGADVVMVDGDYKDTYELSKQAIDYYGYYNRNAAINPFLVEGKKTVALEIAEQLDFSPTDWVAVSVGDGCTIAGVYKGFYDLFMLGLIEKIPKLLGVQSSGCSPFVNAFENDMELEEAFENTIADSISVGIPRNPVKAMLAVKNSLGSWVRVDDEDILKYMRKLGSKEGIFGEPAGVAALAGIRKAVSMGIINPLDSVTMIMTGSGLKDPLNAEKACKPPILIKNDLKALVNYLNEKGDK